VQAAVTRGEIYVVTAEVRRSADHVEVVAAEASSSRTALAAAMSGNTAAWKSAGRGGFEKFIDVLEQQAARLRTDLTGLGDKLRAAADVYERQDLEGGAALDTSMRRD
jgi:uncharacterized protein YukE